MFYLVKLCLFDYPPEVKLFQYYLGVPN